MTPEATGFLYPFIEGDEHDVASLLADLAISASAKSGASASLRAVTVEQCSKEIEDTADSMATRFASGGRMLCAGNGGSSTDAASLASLFAHPPTGRALAARSLVADEAILTALGNDVGFDLVFSRQIIAYGRADDMFVGFSTSGDSENLMRAFSQSKMDGLLTVGFAGYEGGTMAACGVVDHLFVVRSDSVHRIQETQGALAFALWTEVQSRLDALESAL